MQVAAIIQHNGSHTQLHDTRTMLATTVAVTRSNNGNQSRQSQSRIKHEEHIIQSSICIQAAIVHAALIVVQCAWSRGPMCLCGIVLLVCHKCNGLKTEQAERGQVRYRTTNRLVAVQWACSNRCSTRVAVTLFQQAWTRSNIQGTRSLAIIASNGGHAARLVLFDRLCAADQVVEVQCIVGVLVVACGDPLQQQQCEQATTNACVGPGAGLERRSYMYRTQGVDQ